MQAEASLTAKQKEVCGLIVLGFSSKEIGAQLGISHRTVDAHREEIYRRLDVRNAVQLAAKIMGERSTAA